MTTAKQITGVVERVELTLGGNQYTTIDGIRYMTLWDALTRNWKEGDVVQFTADDQPPYIGAPKVLRAKEIMKVQPGMQSGDQLSFEQFTSQRERVADLGLALGSESEKGIPGYVYPGRCFIAMAKTGFNLHVGSSEWTEPELDPLERIVYSEWYLRDCSPSPVVEAQEFHSMRGHVAEGVRVKFESGEILTVRSALLGWKLVSDDASVSMGPYDGAMALTTAIVQHANSQELEARAVDSPRN